MRLTTTQMLSVLGAMRLTPIIATADHASAEQPTRLIVALLLAGALEAYILAAATRTWRLFFLTGFPFFLSGILFAGYTIMYGTPPGRSLAMIILTTSVEEIAGFLAISAALVPTLMVVLAAAVYLYLALKVPNNLRIASGRTQLWQRALLASLIPATGYAAWYPNDLIDGLAYSPTTGTALFIATTVPRANAALHGSQVAKIPYHASRTGGEEVHVLVLGESARRDSWSVYGYRRPTTPYLASLKGEAIFLQHAVADANLTTWSVPILVSGMTPEQFTTGTIRGNIVDLAREAGYGTAWLLNQDITISVSAGITPDRLVYPADFKSNILDRHALDATLLPGYRREINRAGHARFIGIHMIGSHWEYYRRYPPAFNRFIPAEHLSTLSIFQTGNKVESAVVDSYDNTVLYTDWFLQQIIEAARRLTVPATVMFFPDHGEDLQALDGKSGHGAPEYTQHAFEIPAFVWVNDAYRRTHPDKVTALESNAGREIRSHDVFNTEADLLGVTWPGAEPARSFASPLFIPDTATKFAAGGVLIAGP